jgi:hypothetical protein
MTFLFVVLASLLGIALIVAPIMFTQARARLRYLYICRR